MAQGVSFGQGPHIAAGIDMLTHPGSSYSDNLAKERGLLDADQQNAPKSGMAGRVVGSLLNPAAMALGGAASRLAGEGTGIAANALRGAAGGAAVGAAQGAGDSESLGEVPGKAVKGALMGGATGGVLGGTVGYGLERLAGNSKFGMNPAVARRLTQAGISPEDAQNMRPDEMLADQHPQLAYAVSATAGDQGQPMVDALQARNATMPSRLADSFERSLGVKPGSLAMADADMEQAQQAAAGPLFQAARQTQPVQDPKALEVFDRPLWQGALRAASEDHLNKTGQPLPDPRGQPGYGNMVANASPDLQARLAAAGIGNQQGGGLDFDTFQSVKRIARQAISAGYDENANVQSANRARAAWPTFQNWVKQVYASRPEWQQANEVYAGHESMQDALEEGAKDFGSVRAAEPYDIRAKLSTMGAAERQAYAKGALSRAVQQLQSLAGSEAGTANIPRQAILSSVLGQDKLSALALGMGKSPQGFLDTIDQLAGEQNTFRQVAQGSQTAARQQAMRSFGQGEGPGLADALEAHISPHRYGFSKVAELARGMQRTSNQQAAAQAVPVLTATGPDLHGYLASLAQRNTTTNGVRALQKALATASGSAPPQR